MNTQRMRTSRQQLIEEPATLADRTANGAGADAEPARELALVEAAILETLEECETYFENRSGADHDETGFVPNEEMRILVSVRDAIRALSAPDHADASKVEGDEVERKFQLGDRVTKNKGSSWTGRVVGFYSTELTPTGYAVESETEIGSVQIYPEAALCFAPSAPASEGAE
jgi:dihydrofolate reductase (trimethoprim resistance protein)